jgi:REP element-mobilizing transposase RayT
LSFCKKERSLRIYAYVILDNHFHLIAKAPELSDTMAAIKKYTAREIVSLLSGQHKDWMLNLFSYYKSRHKKDSQSQIWQEGSHPQLIISPEMLEQKIEYIHYNPVKRGVVKTPEAWVYSSARNYILGDHSVLPLNDLSEL